MLVTLTPHDFPKTGVNVSIKDAGGDFKNLVVEIAENDD
jgi:hypothetical protein